MEGEEERLAVLWTELEEALMEVSRGRLEKPLRMRQKGYLRAAAEEIYAATRMRPVAASVLLQSAQILSENGEWGRIPFVLEGLLTAPGAVRPMEELREGLRLLEHADDLLPSARIRREFLLSALRIQMAEAGDAGVSPEDCARKLEQLYRARGQGEKGAWLQEHLLPLYAARGWLLAGNTVNAVSDLRLCLDVCPDNGYAIQLLGKISLDYLTNRERHLHDWMKEGAAAPVAETSVGLRWIGVHHRPLTLRPGELVRTTDFLFLVEQEVDQELTAQLSFHNDAGQKLFTAQKPRVMRKSSSLTWRIGELIEFTSDERFVKGPGQLYPPGRLFLQFRLVDFKKRPAQMWPEGLLPAGCMEAQAEPEKEK
jgi:hypothetical protein